MASAFPSLPQDGSHVVLFEDGHRPQVGPAFTHGFGLLTRRVANATLSIDGFNSFVSSNIAPIATGWNNKLPDGTLPC